MTHALHVSEHYTETHIARQELQRTVEVKFLTHGSLVAECLHGLAGIERGHLAAVASDVLKPKVDRELA